MAWETRNGKSYFYAKKRQGRKVVSEYLGSGLVGQLQSQVVEDRKRAVLRLREQRLAMAKPRPIDLEIDQTSNLLNALITSLLLLGGLHQHKRQWRKRRIDA